MGAGSSKEDKPKDTARDAKSGSKPVANVNNQQRTLPRQNEPAQKTFITQPDENVEEKQNSRNLRRNENVRSETGYERQQVGKPSTDLESEWRLRQESGNELNEVLQIPSDNRYNGRSVNTVHPVRQDDLPETYAQRKQREQYTLNQQMLIRQKTIYRNPDEWNGQGNDEESHAGSGGFDPNKFRSANISQSTKSNLFTTSRNQENSVQYMPGRQNMDDFDVATHQTKTAGELPRYNASELDLMESLERELM